MNRRRFHPLWILLSAAGCTLTGGSDTGDGSDSSATTLETSAGTTGAGTTGTDSVTTMSPPVTDGGPIDSGEFDTGPMPDFPTYGCSMIDQDCAPGYKCVRWIGETAPPNQTRCVAVVEDPSAPGEPCTMLDTGVPGEDDCDSTSMCWNVDAVTNAGECHSFCTGDEAEPTCPNPCDPCTFSEDSTLAICVQGCDPLVQECDPGMACYASYDSFTCLHDTSTPEAEIGTPCQFINQCPAGMRCADSDTIPDCEGFAGCCTPYCPVGEADICPGLLPGTSCTPIYAEGGPPRECSSVQAGACTLR